jgi:transposase
MYSITYDEADVVVGVDTHKDIHVAHVKDALGRPLGTLSVPTTSTGYDQLLTWAHTFGPIKAVGIEGASSYGAGLSRFLTARQVTVLEVGRPNRQRRARRGKSDAADAEAAAAAVLAGDALGEPKSTDGVVEAMRILQLTRASAVKAKVAALLAMQDLVVTAPQDVRDRLRHMKKRGLVIACAAMTPPEDPRSPEEATIAALVLLGRRAQMLTDQAAELEAQITALVRLCCPQLLELAGVGSDTAATLLITAGDNGGRIGSEAAFAKICGVSPVDASSGRQIRHRLNRGGNRQANRALHRIIVTRLRVDDSTRTYMQRRLGEGKTKTEVMRCLKRYAIREVFQAIQPPAVKLKSSADAA